MRMTLGYRLAAVIVGLLLSGAALAQADRGLYRCTPGQCPTESIVGNAMSGLTSEFQYAEVNPGLNIPQYFPNDTQTFCNGSYCMTYFFRTTVWQLKSVAADTGQQAHGDKLTKVPERSSENIEYPADICAPNYAINSHYEWYDMYSNGQYIGSWGYHQVIDLEQIGTAHNCV